jgi:hypothetical protein
LADFSFGSRDELSQNGGIRFVIAATAAAATNSYVASFDEVTVLKFLVATTANTAVCTTIHDDTRRYTAMETRHNGGHGNDEYMATLSVPPLLLLCHKGNEDQLYCTTAGREVSASLP